MTPRPPGVSLRCCARAPGYLGSRPLCGTGGGKVVRDASRVTCGHCLRRLERMQQASPFREDEE